MQRTNDDDALARAVARCADEPIHVPGSIQPHGVLLVLAPDAERLLQASDNARVVLHPSLVPGASLREWPGAAPELLPALKAWRAAPEVPLQGTLQHGGQTWQLIAQAGEQGLLVELQLSTDARTLDALYPRVQRFLGAIDAEAPVERICEAAAVEVRRLTGFDRVLVYRFDDDWNGNVIAEDGNGALPSYLDLRFPASDIPAQARELYRRNRVRQIPNADYEPVPVQPAVSPIDGRPLDLSPVSLRSVSPVHLAYMRNMGTAASMSVSIVIDGRLWGLLSCHNATPRRLGPPVLTACDFLGQMLALQIGARERSRDVARRLAQKDVEVELLARMSRAPTLEAGLGENPAAWLSLLGAGGAAVVMQDASVRTAGQTPDPAALAELVSWIHAARDPADAIFATDRLPALHAPAAAYAAVACGVLAVSVSSLYPHYVIWFRPELTATVRWAGRPDKVADGDGRLHPRRSFAVWSEQVRGRSAAWTAADVDAARSFRNGVVQFVFKRAEERAALTEQLQASNRELEAFSYSISHDLRAPFRHIAGFAQLLREHEKGLDGPATHYLDSIVEAAVSAGRLVDDLLTFSQLGRTSVDAQRVDMAKLVAELRQSVKPDEGERRVEWRVGRLPAARGDPALLRQTLANLIDNALKYTRPRDVATIEIAGEETEAETVYAVRDNGVGFDMTYAGKLFGVFQRLHRAEEFEGSGIGLALCKRIIERHGGWIRAEGAPGVGATFRFGLPKTPPQNQSPS